MLMPRCGISGLTPARFCVPENPITAAQMFQAAELGLLTPAKFAVPENPITRAMCGVSGCSCNCPSGLCSCGNGMGDIGTSLSSFTSQITSGGWQTYAALGAGVVLLFMLTGSGGRQRKTELATAKAQYLSKRAQITGRYPKRYERALSKVV